MTKEQLEEAVSEIGAFAKIATSPYALFQYLRKAMKDSPVKAMLASVALGYMVVTKVQSLRRHRAAS